MRTHSILVLAAVLLLPAMIHAEDPPAGKQVEQLFESPTDLRMPYLMYLPKDYSEEAAQKWPVMLFLHGRGESTGPLSIVAKWGPPKMAARGKNLPYILISPQCPKETNWNDPLQQKGVLDLLDFVVSNYSGDKSRIYLTGLSMGGYGCWKLAAEHGERFAAVAPICGGGDPSNVEKLVELPIWAFHGKDDKVVPFERSRVMVEAIKKVGGTKIRFTEMEGVGHNSWSGAYGNPELFEWFNRQRGAG